MKLKSDYTIRIWWKEIQSANVRSFEAMWPYHIVLAGVSLVHFVKYNLSQYISDQPESDHTVCPFCVLLLKSYIKKVTAFDNIYS